MLLFRAVTVNVVKTNSVLPLGVAVIVTILTDPPISADGIVIVTFISRVDPTPIMDLEKKTVSVILYAWSKVGVHH